VAAPRPTPTHHCGRRPPGTSTPAVSSPWSRCPGRVVCDLIFARPQAQRPLSGVRLPFDRRSGTRQAARGTHGAAIDSRHGSIAVAERAIFTLKQEWLRRVRVIRGLNHLSQVLDDFSEYYNHWRRHSTIGGAVPSVMHHGD